MVMLARPVEYIGPKDVELVFPNGNRYEFKSNLEFGGRKILMVDDESDLKFFLQFVNHARETHRLYQIPKDVELDQLYVQLRGMFEKYGADIAGILAPFLFDDKEDKPRRRAVKR
jgi:hypothetical protein